MLAVLSPVVLWASAASVGADTTRPVIEKQDDLPRHTYTVTGQATALYTSETRDQLLTLAKAIQADIENDLATYDIRDDNTILGFYAALGTVAEDTRAGAHDIRHGDTAQIDCASFLPGHSIERSGGARRDRTADLNTARV